MDFDSIIYIIIAIVIAVVNGALQKKKKAAAKSRVLVNKPHQQTNEISPELENQPYEMDTEEPIDPLEILFRQSEYVEPDIYKTKTTVKTEPAERDLVKAEATKMADFNNKKTHKKTREFASFIHEKNSFDFEEDSIASTSIGNVLTEEEEEQAVLANTSDFSKNFNAKDAILYSEIIKPKYFSAGVNR